MLNILVRNYYSSDHKVYDSLLDQTEVHSTSGCCKNFSVSVAYDDAYWQWLENNLNNLQAWFGAASLSAEQLQD